MLPSAQNNHKHPQIHSQDSLHFTITLAVLRGATSVSPYPFGCELHLARPIGCGLQLGRPLGRGIRLARPLGRGSVSPDLESKGFVSPDLEAIGSNSSDLLGAVSIMGWWYIYISLSSPMAIYDLSDR